jgi:uncharacterized metal-binding protein YceD (DUF177 family)
MKVLVDGIPAAGREVRFGPNDAWAVEAATRSLDRAPARLDGTIKLKRAASRGDQLGHVVIVDVAAEAGAETTCDRCGEPCELAVKVDGRLLFAPEESGGAAYDGLDARADLFGSAEGAAKAPEAVTSGRTEVELGADDLDVGWYSDGAIDLEAVLGEALALETPPRVVCADVGECDKRTDALLATARVVDGPFAALRALKRGSDAGN